MLAEKYRWENSAFKYDAAKIVSPSLKKLIVKLHCAMFDL